MSDTRRIRYGGIGTMAAEAQAVKHFFTGCHHIAVSTFGRSGSFGFSGSRRSTGCGSLGRGT